MIDKHGIEIQPGDLVTYDFHDMPLRLLRVIEVGDSWYRAKDARPAYPLYNRTIMLQSQRHTRNIKIRRNHA